MQDEQKPDRDGQPIPPWIDTLSYWLDQRFRVPGTSWRVGLDGLVGIVPGVGDAATGAVSLFILAQARRLGVRKIALLRMAAYILIDTAAGSIPLLGDLFDLGYKSNRKCLNLLRKELGRRQR